MGLAGMSGGLGPNLFQGLVPDIRPSPEEMKQAEEAIRFSKTVKIKDVFVETYDLGNVKDAAAYAKRMKEMFIGVQARTHVILCSDRQFVKEDGNPRWIAHIEWMEFDLKVKAHPSVPPSARE